MNIPTAIKVLENAVNRRMTDNVNTAEVLEALDFLRRRAAVTWPFEHFRKSLTPNTASSIWIQKAGGRC